MTTEIIETLQPVLNQSKDVGVNCVGIDDFVGRFDRSKIKHWLSILPFDLNQLNDKEKLGFLFTLDSISFSYWGTPKWTVTYHGKEHDGAQGMMACLGRAVERGIIFNPAFLASLKRKDLEVILDGNVEIPLLDERLGHLHELGAITQDHFGGDFRYVLDCAHNDALKLVEAMVSNFPSFRDSASYKGKRVCFNKRAQLLASDINHFFGLMGVEELTACADYKLPQVLRRYKILDYSLGLKRRIRSREEILTGSEEEVEIRTNTIWAIELIKKRIPGLTSIQINDYLWLEGQTKLLGDEPYHLTRTTAY